MDGGAAGLGSLQLSAAMGLDDRDHHAVAHVPCVPVPFQDPRAKGALVDDVLGVAGLGSWVVHADPDRYDPVPTSDLLAVSRGRHDRIVVVGDPSRTCVRDNVGRSTPTPFLVLLTHRPRFEGPGRGVSWCGASLQMSTQCKSNSTHHAGSWSRSTHRSSLLLRFRSD